MSAIQSDAERLAIHRAIETEGERTPAQVPVVAPADDVGKLLSRIEVARNARARYVALKDLAAESKRRADMAFDEYSAAVDALG